MTNAQSIIAALVLIVLASLVAITIRPEIANSLSGIGLMVVIAGLIGALNGHSTAPTSPSANDPGEPGNGPEK